MIGLIEFLKSNSHLRRSVRARSLIGVVLLAAMLLAPIPVLGQPRDQNDDRSSTEDEKPKKKPGLAERNNIKANPLMTLVEEKKFDRKKVQEYTSSLRNTAPRGTDQTNIIEGVRYRVYRMTIPENWSNIANVRNSLFKDIEVFPKDSPRARQLALSSAVKYLSELLNNQPRIVKLNAVLLLGQLNVKPANRVEKTPAVPFAPAAGPLVEVMESPSQTPEVKVAAITALARILNDSEPPRSVRDKIAKVVADELVIKNANRLKEGEIWYLWRLIDTAGTLDEPRNAIQQPIVVDALWKVLLDDTLPQNAWHLRTRAARSLSQLDLDGSFDIGLLAHEVVKLSGIMTVQFNQNPGNPYWRRCFLDVYFAFNAHTRAQTDRGWGLREQAKTPALRQHQKLVTGAYEEVLKLVNRVVEKDLPMPVPNATLKQVADWLQANPPSSQKLHADSKTVDEIQAAFSPVGEESTAVSGSITSASGG